MTTAERIDEHIKDVGLSRREFALMASIPPSSLQSAIERNKGVSLDMLCKITKALNSRLYEILGDKEREMLGFAVEDRV